MATGGSNIASEASYWCNRRETSEIQARAYTGSEALYAHAQYNTQPVGIEGPWHLLSMHGVMPAYKFRPTYIHTRK